MMPLCIKKASKAKFIGYTHCISACCIPYSKLTNADTLLVQKCYEPKKERTVTRRHLQQYFRIQSRASDYAF